MATYTGNLRLTKIASGDESGTWGTTTNTTLDYLDKALGYIAHANSNADETITISDGSTSDATSLYIKVTGSLTANRTITLGPNTLQKVWFIQNATSGGYSVLIKQGSGAQITIASGATAIVYADGAGSAGAMANAIASLQVTSVVAGTLTLAAGSITDSSGAITFGNENLVTTGTLGAAATTLSSTLVVAGATTLSSTLAVTGGVATFSSNVVSDTDSTDDLGTTGVRWANLWVDAITMGGTLAGAVATFSSTVGITGVTTHGDDVVSDTDSTDDLGTTSVRWANLYVDDVVATTTVKPGTLVLAAGSITDTSGAITFGNENLVTTGTLGSGALTAGAIAGTTITGSGVLSIDDATDSTSGTSGSIHTDGGLGVAKALWVATTSRLVGVTTHGGNVVSDTDSTDDLGTTGVRWANLWVDAITMGGTLAGAVATFSSTVGITGVTTHGGNVVSDTDSTDDLGTTGVRWANLYVDDVVATTTVKPGTLVLAAGSITDTSGAITFGNENLVTTGTFGAGDITSTGDLVVNGVGPHTIGGSNIGYVQMHFTGAFTSSGASTTATGILGNQAITGASGDTASICGTRLASTLVTQTATESIGYMSQLCVEEPNIQDNLTGDITVASTVHIKSAPTEGESNYSLLVDAGAVQFDGTLGVTGATTLSSTLAVTGAITASAGLSVTKAAANNTFQVTSSTGSNAAYSSWNNTGGPFYFGVDDSSGGSFSGTAYARLLWSNADVPIIMAVNNVKQVTVSSSSVTMAGSLSVDDTTQTSSGTTGSIHTDGGLGVAKDLFVSGNISLAATSGVYFDGGAHTLIKENSANVLRCVAGGSGGVDLTNGATSWTAVSDERAKNLGEPIIDAMAKLGTLRTVYGTFRDDHQEIRHPFLIAQDVLAVYPEAVALPEEEDLYRLSYTDMVPLIISGMNETGGRVETIEQTVERLTARIDELEAAS